MTTNSIVYLVDDDPRVLRALARLLRVEGLETQSFQFATGLSGGA